VKSDAQMSVEEATEVWLSLGEAKSPVMPVSIQRQSLKTGLG
jgi:hypothetical protein